MSISRLDGWILAGAALALACGGEDGPSLTAPPESRALRIEIVSGDEQSRGAGDMLDYPLVVRVTDARGVGADRARVTWEVAEGSAYLARSPSESALGGDGSVASLVTTTDEAGQALVFLRSGWLGPITVTARIGGSARTAQVTFTARVTMPLTPTPGDGGLSPVLPVGD